MNLDYPFVFANMWLHSEGGEMDKKLRTINTYDTNAKLLAEKFRKRGSRTADIDRAFAEVSKNNPRVFEIGCGGGSEAKEILKRTDNYHGIDISQGMLKLAISHVPDAEFIQADVEYFPFRGGQDIIFAFASLLHSPKEKLEQVLSRGYHALNPGGVFYLSLKHGEYREHDVMDECGIRTFYYYTPELITELAGPSFRVIYSEIKEILGVKWLEMMLKK